MEGEIRRGRGGGRWGGERGEEGEAETVIFDEDFEKNCNSLKAKSAPDTILVDPQLKTMSLSVIMSNIYDYLDDSLSPLVVVFC